MLIPRHWASYRLECKNPKGQRRVVLRYGWSDESEEAARQHAETRAREAAAKIEAGEKTVSWRDRADVYGTDTVPIREEVVLREGDTVVTRNAYGALCLNAPDVFFADVDLPPTTRRVPAFGLRALGRVDRGFGRDRVFFGNPERDRRRARGGDGNPCGRRCGVRTRAGACGFRKEKDAGTKAAPV